MFDPTTYLDYLFENMFKWKSNDYVSLWKPYTYEMLFETEEWKKLEFALSVDHSFALESHNSLILLLPIMVDDVLFRKFYSSRLVNDLICHSLYRNNYLSCASALNLNFERPVISSFVIHTLFNDPSIPKTSLCKCLTEINILNFDVVEYIMYHYSDIFSNFNIYSLCELIYKDDHERSEKTKHDITSDYFKNYASYVLPANVKTCRYVYDLLF